MFKKITLSAFFAAAMFLSASIAPQISAQTLVNYDFNAATTACAASPTTLATGVTSVYTASETTCTTTAGTATNGNAFVQNTTPGTSTGFNNGSATPTKFFQFSLTGVPTAGIINYQVYFQSQRSNTGFNSLDVQYSNDGGTTFNSVGAQTVATMYAASTPNVLALPLSAVNAGNLIIRLVATGATATGGTVRIDNFQVRANAPSAATVNVGGRVTKSNGRGIFRARVKMTDGSGITRYAVTNSLGYYRFSEVEVGQTLIFDLKYKGYNFTEPTQVVSLSEETDSVNFTAY